MMTPSKQTNDDAEWVKKIKSKKWRLFNLYRISNKDGKDVKFKPNLEQRDFISRRHNRNVILKARQLGFTTLMLILMLDGAIFENKKGALIAHTLDDAKRLFREKVEFAYDRLPPHITLANPLVVRNKNEIVFKQGGSVTVDTSFRGGTLQILHVSEMGKISAKNKEKAKEIVTGALPAVTSNGMATIESTAEGREGDFYNICNEAETLAQSGEPLAPIEFKFFFYSWYKKPEYAISPAKKIPQRLEDYFAKKEIELGYKFTPEQKTWYWLTEKTLGDEMRREYPTTPAEAFQQTLEGTYYKQQFARLYENGQILDVLPANEHLPVFTYWDLGVSDSTVIWFIKKIGPKEYHVIDYYENSGEGLEHYAKVIKEKGYNYGGHYAPHDIDNRSLASDGAKSLKQIASEGFDLYGDGIKYRLKFNTVNRSLILTGIEQVRSILPYCYFDKTKCEQGLKALEAYRKEWNDKLGLYRDKPLHDWASHASDAFRYFAVSENEIKEVKQLQGKIRMGA